MSDIKTFEAALEAKMAEQKAEVAAATEKAAKSFESKVEAINEQLAKNNKTIAEAREEVLAAKAAFGKIGAAETKKVAQSYNEHIAEIKSAIGEAIVKGYDSIKEAVRSNGKGFNFELDLKVVGTMTEGSNLTGNPYVSYINSPALRAFVNPHLRSVFNIIPVSTGSVSFPRGNTPVGEGSFGKQTEVLRSLKSITM